MFKSIKFAIFYIYRDKRNQSRSGIPKIVIQSTKNAVKDSNVWFISIHPTKIIYNARNTQFAGFTFIFYNV